MHTGKADMNDAREYWKQDVTVHLQRRCSRSMHFMNRFSLIFHALLACIINFTIEAISRHSLAAAWNYMTGTPLVFLYNAFMIFVTFSIVYLFKRRIFVRIIISALWIILGIANGYILLKRVTPFNAQDLKIAGDGIALINNYCNGFEVVVIAIGAAALVVWLVSMWRRGGQYTGKIHHVASLLGIVVCCILYTFVTNAAIDKRVVSTYFGNIALPMKITVFHMFFGESVQYWNQ